MNQVDIIELGEIIRKVRKERGLRLEDLADENISPATVSNIERGVPHVNPKKVEYFFQKLEISMDQLPEMIMGQHKERQELRFRLLAIESLQRMGGLEDALRQLDEIKLNDSHPYAAMVHWLKGVCSLFLRQFKRAERELFHAIRLSNQSLYAKKENIESYSFNDLSLCSYYQNDLKSAVEYTDSGLDAFNPDGQRKIVKYLLLRNKAIYLERLGRVIEALKVVQETWDELPQIEQIETVLSFYWLRAELLRKSGVYDEAISYAREGIELANLNHQYNSLLDLWTVLGSIYLATKEWEKAEDCFDIVMKIPSQFVDSNRMIRATIQLGKLYLHKKYRQSEPLSFLENAIKKGEELNSIAYLIEALLVTGTHYFVRSQKDEAVRYYERAVSLSNKYQFKEKEYWAWYHLAKCWKGNHSEEFLRCAENMFRIQEELEQQYGEYDVMNNEERTGALSSP